MELQNRILEFLCLPENLSVALKVAKYVDELQNENPQESSNSIHAFLNEPINRPVALEVAKYVEELRARLHESFWLEFEMELKKYIYGTPYEERWIITGPTKYDASSTGCHIRPKYVLSEHKRAHLPVCLAQYIPDFPLCYGLVWNFRSESDPVPTSASYKRILELSKEASFNDKESGNKWWPVLRWQNINLRSDEFMRAYGTNHEEYIKNLAGKVWGFFTHIEPALLDFHQELYQGG